MKLKLFLLTAFLLTLCACNSDTRHNAKMYRLKNHHIVLQDDGGKWWEYTKNGLDIDVDITWSPRGEMVIPQGGSWRAATQQEEEEVSQATNEEDTTVDETDAGSPDGAGDVGGDDGGSGGDSGGDGGDGGGGDD